MSTHGAPSGERHQPGHIRAGPDGEVTPPRADDSAAFASTVAHVPPGDTAAEPTVTGPAHAAPAASAVLQRFGDYELLAEIARGGMGVVYKARQLSLGRIVALKMIRSGRFADDEEVQRFRVEAQAAAHLDHPHIVPVYEVGTHDGRDYYTMGYVEGRSLEQKLVAGPLPAREAADLLCTVAAAIHFAHQKGIIHRDLKPSNVLIAPREHPLSDSSPGRRDRPHPFPFEPRITDFGLARRLESTDRLTITGQVVGTPSYMSPEQAAGQQVGPATDVYSLGALLYCTLTGRPPFRAANVIDTLQQVRSQEPVPPRQITPGVPRDLETICLRCLSKDPAARYATAADLADDLARYLRGETIVARRAPWWERGAKWARRRPAVATLAAVVAVSLGVGIGMAVRFRLRLEERSARVAQQAQLLERESLQRAQAEAEALIASMRAALSEEVRLAATIEDYRSAEFLDPPQRAVLQEAVTRYEGLLPRFERPTEAVSRRLAVGADASTYRELLAGCRFTLGALQSSLGRSSAVESLQAAKKLWETLLAAEAAHVGYRHGLASCCYNLGDYYTGVNELPLAEEFFAAAREHAEQLPPGQQSELLGRILLKTGLLQAALGKLADAGQQFQSAETVLLKQLESAPSDAAAAARLGRVQFSQGLVCVKTLRYAQADPHYRRALDTQQMLVQRVGSYNRSRHDLAATLANYGQLRWQLGDVATGAGYLQQAVDEARILVKLAPSDSTRAILGRCCYHRASLLFSQQNVEDAAPLLEESLSALDAIERDPVPDLPPLRNEARHGLLLVSLQRNDHRRAFAVVEAILPNPPRTGEEMFLAASACAQCAGLAAADTSLGDSERAPLVQQYGRRAVELLRQAVDAGFNDARRLGGAKEWETLRQRDDYQEVSRRINR